VFDGQTRLSRANARIIVLVARFEQTILGMPLGDAALRSQRGFGQAIGASPDRCPMGSLSVSALDPYQLTKLRSSMFMVPGV
jgi:hypothetical protein